MLPASQNPLIKKTILAALARTNIRYADSEDARQLLTANNASCILLSSGNYLVSREAARDDLRLLKEIIHEDIEAIMQVIAKKDRYRYNGIKELVLKHLPQEITNELPVDLYVNHALARAFMWLMLMKYNIISDKDVSAPDKRLLDAVKPVIEANKHNYFTAEFWDYRARGEMIRQALNEGMIFYQTTSQNESESQGEDASVKKLLELIAGIRNFNLWYISRAPLEVLDKAAKLHDNELAKALVRTLSNIILKKEKWYANYSKNETDRIRDRIVSILGNYPECSDLISPVLTGTLLDIKDEADENKKDAEKFGISVDVTSGMYYDLWGRKDQSILRNLAKMKDKRTLPYLVWGNALSERMKMIDEDGDELQWNIRSYGFDPVEVQFAENLVDMALHLQKLQSRDAKDKERLAVTLKILPEFMKKNPERASAMLPFLLNVFPEMRNDLIRAICRVPKKIIMDKVIAILNENPDPSIKEAAAIILSQWSKFPRVAKKASQALKDYLGPEKAAIFYDFGVWVIDLRMREENKFKETEIASIREALSKIPRRHVRSDLCRVILKTEPGYSDEILPEWLSETPGSSALRQRVDLLGTYDTPLKIIRIHRTEDIKNTICHEFGHGVHDYYLTDRQRAEFKRYHESCVSRLPEVKDRYRSTVDYSDFAYAYGAKNEDEDFATIYESWLETDPGFLSRAQNRDLLREKYGIVTVNNRAKFLYALFKKLWHQTGDISIEIGGTYNRVTDIYGSSGFKVLWFDLLDRYFKSDCSYKVKYDGSRLSPSQIKVIETYVEILNRKTQSKFKAVPCSSKHGSAEALISVYREDSSGITIGKGSIDISDKSSPESYLLRITQFVNIALALSNVKENASEKDKDPLTAFIKQQCRLIVGNDVNLPETLSELKIFLLNLPLPNTDKVSCEAIENYNKLTQEALVAV